MKNGKRNEELEGPQKRSSLFWICLLVLVESIVYALVGLATSSGTIKFLAALIAGIALFYVLRKKIWDGLS